MDHPSRQPHPAQCRRSEGRRPSGLLGLARHHHVGAVFLGAAAAGPRRGEAACKPGVSRHPVSVRAPDPRQAGEFSRLQGRAVLSVAHQGHRRRRFLHRLGRPRRRADAVRLAGAGLRQGAWLGQGSSRGADDRAGRRRRDGRGQHLRGIAGGLEARAAQHLVGGRLQPPKPRCRGARRAVGEIRIHVPQFRLGRGDREIRQIDAGCLRRARRRGAEEMDRCLSEPALRGAVLPGRGRVPQAFARRDRRPGAGHATDRAAQRRRIAGADVQSRRPRHGQHVRGLRGDRSRSPGLLHRLHHQGRRPAVPGPQGQPCGVDDGGPDGKMARHAEHPARPRVGEVRGAVAGSGGAGGVPRARRRSTATAGAA